MCSSRTFSPWRSRISPSKQRVHHRLPTLVSFLQSGPEHTASDAAASFQRFHHAHVRTRCLSAFSRKVQHPTSGLSGNLVIVARAQLPRLLVVDQQTLSRIEESGRQRQSVLSHRRRRVHHQNRAEARSGVSQDSPSRLLHGQGKACARSRRSCPLSFRISSRISARCCRSFSVSTVIR